MTVPGTKPYLWMLCGSFSFTIMAELAYGLTRECDWPVVAIARAAFAAIFASFLAYLVGAKLIFLRPRRLWIRSIAGSCSMVCTFYAFANLPTVDVLTLTNTFPLWVALLSWPLYGKVPNWKVWVAVLAGIVGVALIEQPHLAAGNTGAISALAAAVFTAVAMLGLHSLSEVEPLAVVVHFSAVATAFCVAAALIMPRQFEPLHVESGLVWLKLFFLGLTATIGQVFLTRAFGSGSPAKVSVVGLSQIVMVFAYDVSFRGHVVNATALVGTVLVLAPTAWVMLHEDDQPIEPHHSSPSADNSNPATEVIETSAPGERP